MIEILLILWLFWPLITFAVATSKGRSGIGWALLALMFGPLALLFAAAMSPDREVLAKRKPPRLLFTLPGEMSDRERRAASAALTAEHNAALPPDRGFWGEVRAAIAERRK